MLVFAATLTRVTIPRVPRAVDTPELLSSQSRQTLTRARVRDEVLSGLIAGGGALVTLAPARAPVVLQLYAGAVRRAVHVDHHRVRLQLGLLRGAARAQAVQTQTWKCYRKLDTRAIVTHSNFWRIYLSKVGT